MNLQEWDAHTSSEHKWKLDGIHFCDKDERDRVLLGLLYSSGLKHLMEIIPNESKEELVQLIKNNSSQKK